jgi:hypothetical protein
MHDLRGGRGTPPLATRDDRDIMSRILARLFTELELEPADRPRRWEWDPAAAPWPRLLAAVKQHSPRTATLEILAWAG